MTRVSRPFPNWASWIPAFAGMTIKGAGMTIYERFAGINFPGATNAIAAPPTVIPAQAGIQGWERGALSYCAPFGRDRKSSGFTMIELLIVILILEVLFIPLVGVYLLPLRAQATLSALTEVNRNSGLLESHLSDDVRCADSIAIAKTPGERDDLSAMDELRIQRGEESVVYRSAPEGMVVRRVEGAVPLAHTFDSIEAVFSLDESGKYKTVRVDSILDYRLLRAPFKRQRTALFCSRLETRR